MSFPSLIAHNGVSHQRSSPTEKPQTSLTETQPDPKPNFHDSQMAIPESNSTLEKQAIEIPKAKIETETKIETLSTTDPVPSDLATATLVPGFGESIFILLIASPFLLLGFKKWLHR